MELFIIEGAGKVKKISSYLKDLGMNTRVIATCGHIERLKDSEYDGTGISKDLKYNFEFIEGKSKIIKEINDCGANANTIYIATDPDREGEGISWHIYNKLNATNKAKSKRITFNEISLKAIKEAIQKPRNIDINYVNAYLARIALDKKIGYGLSKFLQQTVNLPSAGRVQSVVLKLIRDRENDIKNFVAKTIYFLAPSIQGIELKHTNSYNDLSLFSNHLEKPYTFLTEESAISYQMNYLKDNKFKLFHIAEPEQSINYPSKPFKTSTAQAELIKQLKINSKQAEKILQELYQTGYITYPRTDATRISEDFCNETYNFVKEKYPHLANKEFRFNKSGGGAQDAHEAIRVVHIDELGKNLDGQLREAYNIIYQRTIINFMNPMIVEKTKYSFINNKDEFTAEAKVIVDLGFNEYLNVNKEDNIFNFSLDQIYEADNYENMIKSSTSTPPAPFKQQTLISELEKLGIGRPSTYASSVEVNQQRKYTVVDKKEIISTTENGRKADDILNGNWNELINYTFTSNMESSLDKIAEGLIDYKSYLKDFLNEFEDKLYKNVSLKNENQNIEVCGVCPKCGGDLFFKKTSTGKALKECSNKKWNPKTKRNSGCDFIEWMN